MDAGDPEPVDVVLALGEGLGLLHAQLQVSMGLRRTEYVALSLLDDAGPLVMSQIAAALGLSRAAVTSLVDRLAQLGLVTRQPHSRDRRRTMIAPTARFAQQRSERLAPLAHKLQALERVPEWSTFVHLASAVDGLTRERAREIKRAEADARGLENERARRARLAAPPE